MVHAYHLIFCAYGFWLPNDPRGAWSDYVGKWELAKFGKASKTLERKLELTSAEQKRLAVAKSSLLYPAVVLNDMQISCVGDGFETYLRANPAEVWACSIMPDHVHLVVARHRLNMEQLVRQLKGAATKALEACGLRPNLDHRKEIGDKPPVWSHGKWVGYLDCEPAIFDAIGYVERNPEKEGRPRQDWRFVTRFHGLGTGSISYPG